MIKVRAVDDEKVRFEVIGNTQIGERIGRILRYKKEIKKDLEEAYKEGREISVQIEDGEVSKVL